MVTLHLVTRTNFEVSVEEIYGRINDTLYQTLVSKGENGQLVARLWDILQWDVDFTSVQPEDSLKLIVEKKYLNGDFVKYGNVLAVEFRSSKKKLYGFIFENPQTGRTEHYDEGGQAVRKSLLKVPFRFDPRITSRFSHSRYHPILKVRRPHLGIDYGAPAGTPVVASGRGTVIFSGTKGGYGKLVRIRHPLLRECGAEVDPDAPCGSRNVVTSYAHLSRIQVRRGQKVRQGERIGRVGSTGLARQVPTLTTGSRKTANTSILAESCPITRMSRRWRNATGKDLWRSGMLLGSAWIPSPKLNPT